MNKPSEILFICSQPFFEWRGSPIRVGFDLLSLTQTGYRVHFLTIPHGKDRSIPGVRTLRCFRLPGTRKGYAIGPSVAKFAYDLIHLIIGAWLIASNHRIHAIHAVEDSCVPGVLLSWVFDLPLVFEKHSDPASYKRSGSSLHNWILSAYQWYEHRAIFHAKAVIGTGDELVSQARELVPDLLAYSIPDIPSSLDAADPESVSSIRSTFGDRDSVVATYVGSFAIYQGIDLLFDSMHIALSRDANLKLVIIGGSPSEIQERKRELEALGVADQVHFLGFVDPDTLPSYLAASDILLSPRISGRNSPLKVLDYLKAERCIVATDNAANRQILSDEVALLCEAQASTFAEAVLTAANDADLRRNLASNAKALLATRYHFGYFRSRIAAVYTSLGLDPERNAVA